MHNSVTSPVDCMVSDCLFLKSPAYAVDPWLVSGNLNLEKVPTIPGTDKSDSRGLNSLHKQHGLYREPAFLWESGVSVCAWQRLLTWPVADKNLGAEFLTRFLVGSIPLMLSPFIAGATDSTGP